MNDTFALLEEYCPPVDAALLSAILSDFDPSDRNALIAARETLDAIKASAAEEEASSFDPSGAHFAGVEENGLSEKEKFSATRSGDTDVTSMSDGVHSLQLGDPQVTERFLEQVETLDVDTKAALLKEMFPNMKDFTILYSLNKYGQNWNRTIEELLNLDFLDGQGRIDGELVSTKGVDAFSEDNTQWRGRKRKIKRKVRTTDDSDLRINSLPAASSSNGVSPWDTAKKDVEFISTRTNLSVTAISSVYHQHGASLSATIIALLSSSAAISSAPETTIRTHAQELGKDFPSIPSTQLTALIRLTHPSTTSAHDLARALITPKQSCTTHGGIQIIPHYSPPNLSDDESSAFKPTPSRTTSINTPSTIHTSSTLADTYTRASHLAFTKASSAYRRGKSDRLMAAAAGYYSQLGRDYASLRVEATADAADELVASQSRREEVDLHGVSVRDAVRIARREVEGWWSGAGGKKVMGVDGRVVDEGGSGIERGGLRIVTGMGRHSEGGRAKITPAVGKMLREEGWRCDVAEGVITVVGK